MKRGNDHGERKVAGTTAQKREGGGEPGRGGALPRPAKHALTPRCCRLSARPDADRYLPVPSTPREREGEQTLAEIRRKAALPKRGRQRHTGRARCWKGRLPGDDQGVRTNTLRLAREKIARQGIKRNGQPAVLGVPPLRVVT
ncbi:hypothetical protein MRX96_055801 [Rhipicephalus microplus]